MKRMQWFAGVIVLVLLPALAHAQSTQPQPTATDSLDALHRQLNQQLASDGAPRAAGERARTAIEAVAAGARRLAQTADEPTTQLRARQLELRAIHGLVQGALRAEQPLHTSLALTRLHRAIEATRELTTPGSAELAESWQLNADLIDIRRNSDNRAEAARRSIAHLEQFIDERTKQPAQIDAPSPLITRARRALLKLYDQTGHTKEAKALLPQLPDGSAGMQVKLAAARLGQAVDFTVPTRDGPWALADQRGAFVVVHVYRAARGMDEDMAAALRRAEREMGEDVRVLQAPIGSATRTMSGDAPSDTIDAPIVDDARAAEALARHLGVVTLPRVVVIDRSGRYVAAGASPRVVDRLVDGDLADDSAQTQPK